MDSESDSSRMLKRLYRSHMHDAALDEVGAEDLKFGVSVFRIYIPSWKHTLDSIA